MIRALLILLLIAFANFNVFAQVDYATLSSGDTIRVGDKFKINHVALLNIYPSNKMMPAQKSRYISYLNSDMVGNTYQIEEIKLYKSVNKKIAVFSIYDKNIQKSSKIEFNVNIEPAIKNGEIMLIK